MNSKLLFAYSLTTGLLTLPLVIQAAELDTNNAGKNTYNYDFSRLTIPDNAGQASWFDDMDRLYRLNLIDASSVGHVTMTVSGTQVGTAPDGATVYATSNPGIGVAYQLNYSTQYLTSPESDNTAPYEIVFDSNPATGYIHVKYTVVRLTEHVPAGQITTAPQVTLFYKNIPATSNAPDISFLALSGTVSGQPQIKACNIDAPTEIKLPTIYGTDLVNGAVKPTDAPTIQLKNCPGAVNGITYDFSAVYGTKDAANGVLKTVEGEGYAKGVYIQIQNDDGSAYKVNNVIPLAGYDGSGDYSLPDFKVAYYIPDENNVSAGNVKTAIELKVAYN
ncbi:type 1 fimbrial protein [Salmonella enterica]|nr:type 1 fimbrial protein [Salmonella enterica]